MKTLLFALILSVLLLLVTAPAHAAYLFTEPSQGTYEASETFDVEIWADTEEKEILGIDALMSYDSSILEVVDVLEPPEDQRILEISNINYHDSEIYVAVSVTRPDDIAVGVIPIATLRLRLLNTSPTILDFLCWPNHLGDSNVIANTTNAEDIIDCQKNVPGYYNHGPITISPTLPITPTSSVPTSSPNPTTSPCDDKQEAGDYNCDDKVDLADFEDWRDDFEHGIAQLSHFEYFRRAFAGE